jgi:hypothetical protein
VHGKILFFQVRVHRYRRYLVAAWYFTAVEYSVLWMKIDRPLEHSSFSKFGLMRLVLKWAITVGLLRKGLPFCARWCVLNSAPFIRRAAAFIRRSPKRPPGSHGATAAAGAAITYHFEQGEQSHNKLEALFKFVDAVLDSAFKFSELIVFTNCPDVVDAIQNETKREEKYGRKLLSPSLHGMFLRIGPLRSISAHWALLFRQPFLELTLTHPAAKTSLNISVRPIPDRERTAQENTRNTPKTAVFIWGKF